MLIYILHSDKLYTFRLPKKVFGSYVLHDFDNYGYKRNLVSVHADNDNWILNSNETIKVGVNGHLVESVQLQEYSFYSLTISNTESILLYVAPGFDRTFVVKQISNNQSITIGSSSTSDVIYTNSSIADNQIELSFNNNNWKYKNLNSSVPVYLNGKVVNEAFINNFDDIFLYGLKIVFCGNLIFINNPFNAVHSMSQKLIDPQNLTTVPNNSDSRTFMDFYEENQYFSKSPVFRTKIKTLNLLITGPEDKERNNDSSVLMSVVPSALMCLTSLISTFSTVSNYHSGKTDRETYVTTVIMCMVMLFTSVAWPFVERFVEKIRMIFNERRRLSVYRKYLKKKREVLESARNEQKMSLKFNNLSLKECQDTVLKRTSNLYSVSIDQESFLRVNLGTGRIPMDCKIEYTRPDFIKFKDKLLDEVDKLIDEYKYIDDVPCSFSLKSNIAFINETGNFSKYLNALILQLVTFYDYENLKLVFFTSEKSSLNNIRNLNHCWDNEREFRYFATSLQEGENLSSQLIRIFNNRAEKKSDEKNIQIPYYLIVSDDLDTFRNLNIIGKILDKKENIGFSVLFFADKISDVPSGCSYFVNYNDVEATLFQSQMEEMATLKFKPDFIDETIDFSRCISTISNTPVKINSEIGGMLPDKLGFLEMYQVGNVKQLNSVNRWNDSKIINTLAVPIGVDTNGNILNLDLHERKHGPHGLIAGMTGSGKSEFIITYILSLAVNYSPNEVQFVLIDYKGGGLAGAFENRKIGMKLPHLVGTITNLDKSSMNRTLVSIKSELQRRQRVFNEAKEILNTGTIDIYKYQKLVREGALHEYMSHLFIICDEFAELKAQQPDFMDELVSAARIGRSLGVHLILATQKPSGVVDDQIWSNAKFKVCCKVQTADDSKEMIRRDDAAYIKESGRFYLQVGYDEIFVKGQSAYTGTQYVPSETVNISNGGQAAIEFVDNSGNVIKSIKPKNNIVKVREDLGEELGNVLRYLIECSKEINFVNQQLWLDNVPENLLYYDLIRKYPVSTEQYIINPIIGEYDDPQNQNQGSVSINLTANGNLWISGSFGGGKTTLLSTLIYSSIINHSTDELNIYIVDLLAETLKIFSKAPQVGDFVSASESGKLAKLFHFLNKEIEKRKKYFSNTGGSFNSEIKSGKNKFSNILVFINGVDVMVDQFDTIYNDLFQPIIRDCNRVGITFVITSTGGLMFTVENCFPQKIAMRYLDSTEYSTIFNDTKGIIPAGNPGRGLVELDSVYEFQTALIFDSENFDYNLSYVINQLNKSMRKAPPIPIMPRVVSVENFVNSIITLDMVPIGLEMSSNCEASYDFSRLINIVIFSNLKMALSFVSALLILLNKISNIKVFVLNALGDIPEINGIKIYDSNFKSMCIALYQNILKKKDDNSSDTKIVFVINNYVKIQNHLKRLKEKDGTVITIDDLIIATIGSDKFKFILVNDNSLKSVDSRPWSDYLDLGNGILLSTEPDDQTIIDTENSYDEPKINKDTGIIVKDYKRNYIKFIRDK